MRLMLYYTFLCGILSKGTVLDQFYVMIQLPLRSPTTPKEYVMY